MARKSLMSFAGCVLLLMLGCGGGGGGTVSTPSPNASCATDSSAPTGFAATATTSTGTKLIWAAPTPPSKCSISSYTVYENGATIGTATTTGYTVTDLTPATTYSFAVAATDAYGTSSQGPALSVTTYPSTAGTPYNGVTLTGQLIWHSYTTYGFSGVQSWMANFNTGGVYEITPSRVAGAMNYSFNQDGTEVVFMGDDANITNSNGTTEWDIWVATVTSTGLTNVTKITPTDNNRNEDPKFSSDGTKIIFKRDLDNIVTINRSDFVVGGPDQTPPQAVMLANSYESSMPYYLNGSNTNFVFTDNASENSTIQYDNQGIVTTLYAPAGLHAYYPIALNSTQFYYAQSDSAAHDQVYLGDISGDTAVSAAFNLFSYEFADPAPINANWLAYTSTQPGSVGVYNIWLGEFGTGQTYDLDKWIPGANQTNSNLGPVFHGTITTN